MNMRYTMQGAFGVEVSFDGKPPASILTALKAHGFRWHPSRKLWHRAKITGTSDLLAWIDKQLHPNRPDGKCWTCQSESGFFRSKGAATPVLCAECWAKEKEEEARAAERRIAADDFDLANNRCL